MLNLFSTFYFVCSVVCLMYVGGIDSLIQFLSFTHVYIPSDGM